MIRKKKENNFEKELEEIKGNLEKIKNLKIKFMEITDLLSKNLFFRNSFGLEYIYQRLESKKFPYLKTYCKKIIDNLVYENIPELIFNKNNIVGDKFIKIFKKLQKIEINYVKSEIKILDLKIFDKKFSKEDFKKGLESYLENSKKIVNNLELVKDINNGTN